MRPGQWRTCPPALYGARMRCRVDYGTNGLHVTLPGERVTIIEPLGGPAVADPQETLMTRSARRCGGCPPLRRWPARPAIAISVCDVTRAQPRREMLNALFEEMPDVRPEDVTILIATGTHRANTDAELERMLGRDDPESLSRDQPRRAGRLDARRPAARRPASRCC